MVHVVLKDPKWVVNVDGHLCHDCGSLICVLCNDWLGHVYPLCECYVNFEFWGAVLCVSKLQKYLNEPE